MKLYCKLANNNMAFHRVFLQQKLTPVQKTILLYDFAEIIIKKCWLDLSAHMDITNFFIADSPKHWVQSKKLWFRVNFLNFHDNKIEFSKKFYNKNRTLYNFFFEPTDISMSKKKQDSQESSNDFYRIVHFLTRVERLY